MTRLEHERQEDRTDLRGNAQICEACAGLRGMRRFVRHAQ
jgi:hypothetical protein